ncbi:MAG: ATP synthase F0 subunit C [Planctomycetota bacterium]
MDKINLNVIYFPSVAIAAFGSALALSRAVVAGLESMARQPESAGKIQTAMIIGCAFIEALTIYALISAFFMK